MFNRIMVIGCSGAGKSTLSRRLRDITGLPLYHLDMIYWKPDKTTVSREEFDRRLSEIVALDKWIIDGNYQRTLKMRLERCDTVFLLDYPLEVCLDRAEKRVGTVREDMPWVETEFDEEFKQWIIGFPTQQLPETYRMLNETEGKNVYILKSDEDFEKALEKIKKALESDYTKSK